MTRQAQLTKDVGTAKDGGITMTRQARLAKDSGIVKDEGIIMTREVKLAKDGDITTCMSKRMPKMMAELCQSESQKR